MNCQRCGAENRDGAKFCSECGASLPASSPSYTPNYSQVNNWASSNETSYTTYQTPPQTQKETQQSKNSGKKKGTPLIVTILIAVIVYFVAKNAASLMLSGGDRASKTTDSSSSPVISVPETSKSSDSGSDISNAVEGLTDLITLHKSFMTFAEDGVEEYLIIYYGNDSHIMTAVTDEIHLLKDAGYSADNVRDLGLESEFPSFAEISISDDGDYISYVVKMDRLNQSYRLREMVDGGWIVLEDDSGDYSMGVDAESFIDSILANGAEDVSYNGSVQLHY